MPFKSEKQRKWMNANEPDMAKKWEKEENVNEVEYHTWPDNPEPHPVGDHHKDEVDEAAKRDYKDEYKKFQSSDKSKKYRAELNKYNRKKGTYGNGDGKDASHKGGKIAGFEKESVNRGRREKSRLKKEQKLTEVSIWFNPKVLEPYLKKLGLKFPKYPKQGDVTKDGKKVGYMDNFNGFSIYSKSLLKQLQKVEKK